MPDRFKEKTDWSNIEQALLKHGLDFNRYGIKFNDRNFELTRMYLSGDYTILTFYNQKGFKSMFNGMEFPLLIVAEYEDAIEDINKERPDDIRIFDDVDDGYSYASHLDSRAEEYSRYKNSRDFLLTQKELCEGIEMKDVEIKEECRIPGTDIVLEPGDVIQIIEAVSSKDKEALMDMMTDDFISALVDMEMEDGLDWDEIEKLMKKYAKDNKEDYKDLRRMYGDELKAKGYE